MPRLFAGLAALLVADLGHPRFRVGPRPKPERVAKPRKRKARRAQRRARKITRQAKKRGKA